MTKANGQFAVRAAMYLALTAVTAGAALAADVKPDRVKFDGNKVPSALTATKGNAADGKKWFANRKLGNCLACHVNKDMADKPFHGEIGPAMDAVADRYSEGQLRAILINSKAVFGSDAIMPAFYRLKTGARTAASFEGKTILSGQQVEDIVAYLLTLKE